MRVIVIGASHAGIGFVDAMRRNGFDGELVLLDALVGQPLERPPCPRRFFPLTARMTGAFRFASRTGSQTTISSWSMAAG
ncbi:MAG: hypothetical protein CM15mP115_11820 [Alphaproteobacteria bacterium]|nr:MAG: hypothetical protein CM15mP115_11820 [Alphaproteobacteria bacterium]